MNRRLRIIGTFGEKYLDVNGYPITSEWWDNLIKTCEQSPKKIEVYLQEQYYSCDIFKNWETIAQYISDGKQDLCEKCGRNLEFDHNSKQCHYCHMLWPIFTGEVRNG